MNSSMVLCLVVVSLALLGASEVSGQTFQYSRGWTNGKRGGYEPGLIDRILANPCQLEKLRYILQGKPINEKLMVPCDLLSMQAQENEAEPSMRLRREAPQRPQPQA